MTVWTLQTLTSETMILS